MNPTGHIVNKYQYVPNLIILKANKKPPTSDANSKLPKHGVGVLTKTKEETLGGNGEWRRDIASVRMMEDALQPASPFIPKDFPLTDEYGVIPSCVPTRQWVYNIVRWPLAIDDVVRQHLHDHAKLHQQICEQIYSSPSIALGYVLELSSGISEL